jgi:hypothetical protein
MVFADGFLHRVKELGLLTIAVLKRLLVFMIWISRVEISMYVCVPLYIVCFY